MRHVPCVLHSLGIVNALGTDRETVRDRLLAGDQSGFTKRDDIVPGKAVTVAEVSADLPPVPAGLSEFDCRNNALALAAFLQIEKDIRDCIDELGAHRVGVVMGTSTSGIAATEAALRSIAQTGRFPDKYHYSQHELGGLARFIASVSGARGPTYTVSTACSSSAKVFASARALLETGFCDAVVVGGADSLCSLTVNGFGALEVLSAAICNPISRNRDGITIGEGAALFLLRRGESGVVLMGVGESSDAHHMSAPDPEGRGAEEAMRRALADAGVESAAIDYISLHGTGTPLNDKAECLAVARVFETLPPCSSTKSLIGHTLGAAGAMGAAFAWLMLSKTGPELRLPPHRWDGVRGDGMPAVPLTAPGQTARPALGTGTTLSNAFAFGGNNCSLVIGGRGQPRG